MSTRTTLTTTSLSSMASSEKARLPPALATPAPSITKFKIGLCQLKVTADKERNILHARTAVEEAAKKGAKLVLPERWKSPYSNDSFPVYAEDIDAGFDTSPSTAMLSKIACLLKITIIEVQCLKLPVVSMVLMEASKLNTVRYTFLKLTFLGK